MKTLKQILTIAKPFCSRDKSRQALWYPRGTGAHICASNNRILIKLPYQNNGSVSAHIIYDPNVKDEFGSVVPFKAEESFLFDRVIPSADDYVDDYLLRDVVAEKERIIGLWGWDVRRLRQFPKELDQCRTGKERRAVLDEIGTGHHQVYLNINGIHKDRPPGVFTCLDVRYLFKALEAMEEFDGAFRFRWKDDMSPVVITSPLKSSPLIVIMPILLY